MAYRRDYPHLVLASIKAAAKARRTIALLPFSAFNWYFLEILKREGMVRGMSVEDTIGGHQKIKIMLPFLNSSTPIFPEYRTMSKPSKNITVSWRRLKHIMVNRRIRPLLRTEFGLEWGSTVVQRHVGGELLFYFYN